MKKVIVLLLALTLVVGTGVVVYAEDQDLPEWFTEMINWRKGQVEEAVEANEMTEEEAQEWFDHMDEMEEYHLENGFENMGPGNMGPGRGCDNFDEDGDESLRGGCRRFN